MPSTSTPIFNSSESEKRWVNHMRLNYINNYTVRPCVFHVPDNMRDTKPEAYTPQLVGLGPYHHFLPQVQRMESDKRATVLDYLQDLDKKYFAELVKGSPEDFEPTIRSCYDRYLDLDKETLAWVIIVDGLFLLDLIDYLGSEKKEKSNPGSEDVEKDKLYSKPGAWAADVLMLENQIPIVLIQEMRVMLRESFDNVNSDAELFGKFIRFCYKHSPLELTSDSTSRDEAFDKKKHLLHFMYQMIVKNKSRDFNPENISQGNGDSNHDPVGIGSEANQEQNRENRVIAIAKEVASHAGEFLEHGIEEFDSALSNAKIAGLKLPGNVEKVTDILRNVQKNILHHHEKEESLGDENDIPSAWRLYVFLNIKFKPLPKDCGIGNITLDGKKRILYLPIITLRANSEVILRNLAAYEATSKMGSTQMRDYVDLMRELIKSEKDVDLLVGSGIIHNEEIVKRKIPPGEIVKMFEGITKSDEKPDEKSEAANAAEDIKNKFNDAPIVKSFRCCMKVRFFPLLVVLLLAIQSYCDIWGCRRSSLGGEALRDLYLGDLDPKASLMLPRKLMYRY